MGPWGKYGLNPVNWHPSYKQTHWVIPAWNIGQNSAFPPDTLSWARHVNCPDEGLVVIQAQPPRQESKTAPLMN